MNFDVTQQGWLEEYVGQYIWGKYWQCWKCSTKLDYFKSDFSERKGGLICSVTSKGWDICLVSGKTQVIPEYILGSSAFFGMSVWEGEVLQSAFFFCWLKGGQDRWKDSSYFHLMLFQEKWFLFKGRCPLSSGWAHSCQLFLKGLTGLSLGLNWAGLVVCQGKEEGQLPGLGEYGDQQVPADGPSASPIRRFGAGSGFGAPCATCCDDTCLRELGIGDRTNDCRSSSAHAVRAVLPLIWSQCPCPCLPHSCSAVPCS